MIKIKNILTSIIILVSTIVANTATDISFLDLPVNSRSASLGNTFLSDIGNPSNLLLNPSNIWFGDRVNSNKKWNIFPRFSYSGYDNKLYDYDNIASSFQFGNGLTVGLGMIQTSQGDIYHYDSNANYLGEIKHTQSAFLFGGAFKIAGINFGMSGAYVQTDFSDLENYGEQDDILVTSIGLSMNNKSINIDKGNLWIEILIPDDISLHFLSRNVISDISTEVAISRNSFYRNIIGVRLDNNVDTEYINIPIYFLLDYKSNNSFTNNSIDWGLGSDIINNSNFGLSFNIGAKNIWEVGFFNEFSFGFDVTFGDTIFGFTSLKNPWGGDTYIGSLTYSFDKR